MLPAGADRIRRPQETVMFKKIFGVISLVLLGWFAFMVAAMAFAAIKGRRAVEQDPAADEVDLVATFGELDFRSTSAAFRGGTVTTWFGGGTLDLRGATLDPGGATLRVNALFGGGNLVVPDEWNVKTKITGIGGVGDGRPEVERPADAPTLRLEGTAMFGGWGITSEPDDEEELEGASA
jgi:predicted membrane protein